MKTSGENAHFPYNKENIESSILPHIQKAIYLRKMHRTNGLDVIFLPLDVEGH